MSERRVCRVGWMRLGLSNKAPFGLNDCAVSKYWVPNVLFCILSHMERTGAIPLPNHVAAFCLLYSDY